MIDSYKVMLQGKSVGTVKLVKNGLYYQVQCICTDAEKDIYRLLGCCAGEQVRFGILLPEGNKQVLETKIPAKKLAAGDLTFWLESVNSPEKTSAKAKKNCKYIPVYPDEPFDYLTKLKNSYLEFRNGNPGIMITD